MGVSGLEGDSTQSLLHAPLTLGGSFPFLPGVGGAFIGDQVSDQDGYVLLFRRLLGSEWRTMSAGQSKVMVGCLLLANWRDETAWVSGHQVPVLRGQFISSIRDISAQVGVTLKVARGGVKTLKSTGFLKVERLPGGAHEKSLFTVRKYTEYQDGAIPRGTPKGTACALPCGPEGTPKGTRSIYEVSKEEPEPLVCKKKPTKRKAPAKKAERPGTALLQHYYDAFKAKHGSAPVVTWRTKDLATAEALLKGPPKRTVDSLVPYLKAYVAETDAWLADKGWPFAIFPSRLQRLQSGQQGLPGYSDDPEDEGWEIPEYMK